ncbi:Tetratricopeptide-like helical, partial [Metarhizium majus ARSEF 297]
MQEQWAKRPAARRSLAAVYDICGELAQALRITEELVQSEEQYSKLDPIYPKLVEDVSRLGIFYYRLENYNSALSCYDRVKTWIKHNAENAVYAVNSVNNQATRLIGRGALSQAKSILEALLRECTKALVEKSEETALVMGNLAFIYHSEKQWTKAEQLGRQVIDTRREVLGPSHHNTLTAMGNLRSLLVDQQKFGEALEVAKEELACCKSAADSVDEAGIDAIIIISGAFQSAGAFEEAIAILDEAPNATESRGPLQGGESSERER